MREPAIVETDPTQLETAILNATLNARDALGEGGTITLATANVIDQGQPFVRLAISDDGEGMPQDVLDRAFEPFFTTKDVGKGTGLGLSQIHGFAAQAGGRAEITSSRARARRSPCCSRKATSRSSRAPTTSRWRRYPPAPACFWSRTMRRSAALPKGCSRDLGCKVLVAECATDAIELLDKEQVDLVLSDVVMPGMSGLALARKLRETHPDLPVLLATGYSDEIRKTGSEFAVLAKPFAIAGLSEAIARALAQGRKAA